jgi:hypothetical protein
MMANDKLQSMWADVPAIQIELQFRKCLEESNNMAQNASVCGQCPTNIQYSPSKFTPSHAFSQLARNDIV